MNILEPSGVELNDFIGTQGQPFGELFVRNMLINDRLVIQVGRLMMFEEGVPDIGMGISYKEPIYKRGKIVGTRGMWVINREDIENLKK